jgi:hypothetical protein
MYPRESQPLDALDGAHDVDQRIERTDFVERHVLRPHSVHRTFGLGQHLEGCRRPRLHRRCQFGAVDDAQQLTDMSVRVVTMRARMNQVPCPAPAVALRAPEVTMRRRLAGLDGGMLVAATRQGDADLLRRHAAAADPRDLHHDPIETQS